MSIRFFTALALFWLVITSTSAQNFADKSHYLIDSLKLDELTQSDRTLLDSALTRYHKAEHDTDQLNALNILCENMMHGSWHKYQMLQYQIIIHLIASGPPPTLKANYLLFLAGALNNLGFISKNQGSFQKGLEYYYESLTIYKELTGSSNETLAKAAQNGVAATLNNIGIVYKNFGNIEKTLEYYFKSLKLYEGLDDIKGVGVALNNIGLIYKNQGDLKMSFEYYFKSLEIREKVGDKIGESTTLDNIGNLYYIQHETQLAFDYFFKSLTIREEIGDKKGLANTLHNIGGLYSYQGDPECNDSNEICVKQGIQRALEYFSKAMRIREEIGDKKGITVSLNSIAWLEMKSGLLGAAKKHAQLSMALSKELGLPSRLKSASLTLNKIAKREGDYEEALGMYELYIQMRDSIKNEETQKATIRQQTKYEFERAMLLKEQEQKETARIEAEIRSRRDNLQYSIVLICLLVIGVLVAMLGRLSLPVRMAEGIIFFSFLILFEFLLVLADPYIENWSGGAPGFKLLFNAGIAALIFPMHSLFETKLKGRLVKSKGR